MTAAYPSGPPSPMGAPPAGPPVRDPDRTPRALTVVAVAAGVVLVVVAAVVSVLALRLDRGASPEVVARGVEQGPGVEGWDPRLEPLAAFVAETRGRPFLEPVPVEFLDDDAFRAAVTDAEGELDADDRAALEVTTAQLRALGLVTADEDLLAQYDQLMGEGTLAFYDTETDAVTVRGTEIDAATEVTLVHELTHAWQDQHLGLDRLEDLDDQPAANLRTLAEGDATRVEDAYVATLDPAQRSEYEDRMNTMGSEALSALAAVPDVLQASFALPYAVGPPFVAVLAEEGGNGAVDDALADPPSTDAEVLDPTLFFDGFEPVEVDPPAPAEGQELLDEGPFGAMSLLLALSERLDPRDVLVALDGWAGDASATYLLDGRPCTEIVVAGADPAATSELAELFTAWADAGPDGAATASLDGDRATLRACEPDGGTTPSGERVTLGLQYAALRLTLVQQALGEIPLDIDEAACFAGELTSQISVEELEGALALSQTEAQERGTQAAIACFR